jgi:hypothetical protein
LRREGRRFAKAGNDGDGGSMIKKLVEYAPEYPDDRDHLVGGYNRFNHGLEVLI